MAETCVVEYAENGKVAILKMVKGDNRLNLEFLRDFLKCLDEVEWYVIAFISTYLYRIFRVYWPQNVCRPSGYIYANKYIYILQYCIYSSNHCILYILYIYLYIYKCNTYWLVIFFLDCVIDIKLFCPFTPLSTHFQCLFCKQA